MTCEKVCFESEVKEKGSDRRWNWWLMKTMIWYKQGCETVRQRLRDVDEAVGMIQ